MGMLFPVNGGPDTEIISNLNNVFSGKNLDALREHRTREKLFDTKHRLSRVAKRIGGIPVRYYPNDPAERKWYYFLDTVLSNATKAAIRRILDDTLTQSVNKVLGAKFSAEENAVVKTPHLFPSNSETLSTYIVGNYYHLHLIVKAPASDADQANPPDNPDTDANGNSIEKPINWPSRRPKSKAGRP
jgi:hypothetical protein